ncbi:MAG: hypothetical protein R2698_03570 [Microthrixaceae bacterium]
MEPRRLLGLVIGCAGLAAGVAGATTDVAWPSAAAGVCAVIVGIIAFGASTVADTTIQETKRAKADAEALRAEIDSLNDQLSTERDRHTSPGALGDGPSTHGAGSFEHKLDRTEGIEPSDDRDGQVLSDPETSLFSEAYFRVSLDSRIASARRHLRPVAVGLLWVVEGPGTGEGASPTPRT